MSGLAATALVLVIAVAWVPPVAFAECTSELRSNLQRAFSQCSQCGKGEYGEYGVAPCVGIERSDGFYASYSKCVFHLKV